MFYMLFLGANWGDLKKIDVSCETCYKFERKRKEERKKVTKERK